MMLRSGPRTRDDRGLTLVELLVTMVIAGVIVPLVLSVLLAAQRQTAGTASTAAAVGDVRLAVATMGRQIRTASGPVILDGAPSPVLGLYTTDGSAGARCLQYRVVHGVLRTRSFPVTGSGTSWSTATVVTSSVASTTPFSAIPSSAGSVRVQLAALVDGGRTVSVDKTLSARNSTTTAPPAACAALS